MNNDALEYASDLKRNTTLTDEEVERLVNYEYGSGPVLRTLAQQIDKYYLIVKCQTPQRADEYSDLIAGLELTDNSEQNTARAAVIVRLFVAGCSLRADNGSVFPVREQRAAPRARL